MEVFGDLLIRSVVDFNIGFEVQSTGYNFYVFDSNDEAITGQTFKIDFFAVYSDTHNATESHAIQFDMGNISETVSGQDQGSIPYCVDGYWNDSTDGNTADDYNIGDELFIKHISKPFTEALTASSSVTESDIDISFFRTPTETVGATEALASHFFKQFDEGFNNVYWTPASGTGSYTNDLDNEGNLLYYVGTSLGSVTATESIQVERILGITDPNTSVSVAEVAQVSINFSRSFSDSGMAQDSPALVLSGDASNGWKLTANTTITPPMAPIIVALPIEGANGSAVIDTSPARAPFRTMVKSIFLYIICVRISAARAPPAAAVLVLVKILETSAASPIVPKAS